MEKRIVDLMWLKGCQQRGHGQGAGAERQSAFPGGSGHVSSGGGNVAVCALSDGQGFCDIYFSGLRAISFPNNRARPGGWNLGSGGYRGLEREGGGLWGGGEFCVNHCWPLCQLPEHPRF